MSGWMVTMKPSFLNEWAALPQREAHRVHEKIQLLVSDPTPDAKVKKQLRHHGGKLHRLRSGPYRILYTFDSPYVSLLALRKRDDAYDDDAEGESLGGPGDDDDFDLEKPAKVPEWLSHLGSPPPKENTPLREAITAELLENLAVPEAHRARLTGVATQEELFALEAQGVPDTVLIKVHDALVGRPIQEVLRQPDLVAEDVDDLVRFKEGELLGFLLKLDAEQEKYVSWGLKASGPTLLKGGPGTGKSTVALHRAREMIAALKKSGVARPRLLFTTYTNALVKFSQQLLEKILGPDAALVEVRTADSVILGLACRGGKTFDFATQDQLKEHLDRAITSAPYKGNALQRSIQAQAIARLGRDYLLDEINTVIDARRIATLDDYQSAHRPGRQLALNKKQREAVWAVREAFHDSLRAARLHTWQQVRALAAAEAERAAGEPYDAVIIDEAQDLDPSAIQTLVALCRAPNRLFLTADANQSIYGAGFRWNEIHDSLRFQGRTGVLRTNRRSTREIAEAAELFLANGAIDDPTDERAYANNGPLPAVRTAARPDEEPAIVARFLKAASRELRLGLGGAAVLTPGEQSGKSLARALSALGVTATFMKSNELDLARAGVKVLTLKAAKGLEFPIVAIAGVGDGYPWLKPGLSPEEEEEVLSRERRTLFVAMTRAMRALLVVIPESAPPLLASLAPPLWNTGHGEESSR